MTRSTSLTLGRARRMDPAISIWAQKGRSVSEMLSAMCLARAKSMIRLWTLDFGLWTSRNYRQSVLISEQVMHGLDLGEAEGGGDGDGMGDVAIGHRIGRVCDQGAAR